MFCLVPNIFCSPDTLQSLSTWMHLTERKAKLSLAAFTLPGCRKAAGKKTKNRKEENYLACLHMSNPKYCREPVSKRGFLVYPFSQTIPLQWKSMEYNHWHKNLLCSSHLLFSTNSAENNIFNSIITDTINTLVVWYKIAFISMSSVYFSLLQNKLLTHSHLLTFPWLQRGW